MPNGIPTGSVHKNYRNVYRRHTFDWLPFCGDCSNGGLFDVPSNRPGKWGNFIAQWVPNWLVIGLYNKLIKVEGHDQYDRGRHNDSRLTRADEANVARSVYRARAADVANEAASGASGANSIRGTASTLIEALAVR